MVTDEELSIKIRKLNKMLRKASYTVHGDYPKTVRSKTKETDESAGKAKKDGISQGTIEHILSIVDSYQSQGRRISTSDLAKILGINISTAYRHVKLMEKRGLLILDPHTPLPKEMMQKGDDPRLYRRNNHLKWIKKGIRATDKATELNIKKHNNHLNDCYKKLDADEKEKLSQLLDKLIDGK